jgi:hypothetical protein
MKVVEAISLADRAETLDPQTRTLAHKCLDDAVNNLQSEGGSGPCTHIQLSKMKLARLALRDAQQADAAK